VPAGRSWQKADRALSTAGDRLAVEAAIAANPAFACSRSRSTPGPSYNVDTLAALSPTTAPPVASRTCGSSSDRGAARSPTWHEPERLLSRAACRVPRPTADAGRHAGGAIDID
jgi:hypothetical protein